MSLATTHGWRVRVMYSRGAVGLRQRRRMADVVTVRAARDGVRWWAAWIDRRFDNAQIWRPGRIPVSTKLTSVRQEITRERI